MSEDNATVARLRAIADGLEAIAGTTALNALARDPSIASQLKRIQDALGPAFSTLVTTTGPRTITFVVQDPNNAKTHTERGTRSFEAWLNTAGQGFTISRVRAVADVDDYSFQLLKSESFSDVSVANDVPIATITCSDDGTSAFTANVTSFSNNTIEDGKWLIWEHVSGDAETLTVMIEGSFVA